MSASDTTSSFYGSREGFSRHLQRQVVAFINDPPKVHVIPEERSSWQDGESAEAPSEYDINNAKTLTQSALADAVAEENCDALLTMNQATSDAILDEILLAIGGPGATASISDMDLSAIGQDPLKDTLLGEGWAFDHLLPVKTVTTGDPQQSRGRRISAFAVDTLNKARDKLKNGAKHLRE